MNEQYISFFAVLAALLLYSLIFKCDMERDLKIAHQLVKLYFLNLCGNIVSRLDKMTGCGS